MARHIKGRFEFFPEETRKKKMKSYFLNFVCLVALATVANSLKNTKDCTLEIPIKKCLKMGRLFEPGSTHWEGFARNKQELDKHCEQLKKAEQCSQRYIQHCSETSHESRVLDHLLEGSNRVMKRICRTNTKKNRLLEHVGCANSVIDETRQCIGDYKMLVFAANKLNNKNEILRILCCKIRTVPPCVGDAMRAKGPGVCPRKSIDYFAEMRVAVQEEVASVICADFERDTCTNVRVPQIDPREYRGQDMYPVLKELYDKVMEK